jgi:hypothetical protein
LEYEKDVSRVVRKDEEGLLAAIELILEQKLGSEGSDLLPDISEIEDVEQLKRLLQGCKQ